MLFCTILITVVEVVQTIIEFYNCIRSVEETIEKELD